MTSTNMLNLIDPLQLCVCKITMLRNEIQLGSATGFFYQLFDGEKPHTSLVTNWHVLSGRNANDPLR
ncbi:MAG TPA: hypothetical protein VFV07_10930, partial [Rhizomicrobium sp.]|nr:hypothetical protein [Rhizomicrobium sp.]